MRVKLIFLALIFSQLRIARGQSSSTLLGARSMGMGFSSSTLADEWSLFNNVAGLGKTRNASSNFTYEIRPALPGANRLAASLLMPTKLTAIGVGIFRFGDDIYSENLVCLGLGNTIGNTSLGVRTSYIQYRAEGFGTSAALSLDFGGISQLTPQISVGAYITNLTQSKLSDTDNQRLPTKLVVGLGFKPSDKIFLITDIEKDLEYKATWHGGFEYAVYKKIFFRTGFCMNPNSANVGLGGQKKNLKVDYALAFNQWTGPAHQASVVYLFSPATKK
jgi:hypothetical protein